MLPMPSPLLFDFTGDCKKKCTEPEFCAQSPPGRNFIPALCCGSWASRAGQASTLSPSFLPNPALCFPQFHLCTPRIYITGEKMLPPLTLLTFPSWKTTSSTVNDVCCFDFNTSYISSVLSFKLSEAMCIICPDFASLLLNRNPIYVGSA